MIELKITGACVNCPFMELEVYSYCYDGFNKSCYGKESIVDCKHSKHCDRDNILQRIQEQEEKIEELKDNKVYIDTEIIAETIRNKYKP